MAFGLDQDLQFPRRIPEGSPVFVLTVFLLCSRINM